MSEPQRACHNRNVSLDLYRLLCMFLVTTIHMFSYSQTLELGLIPSTHANFYAVSLLTALQPLALNGFVMLASYFLVNKSNTVKQVVRFELQLVFYSLVIFLVMTVLTLARDGAFSKSALVFSLFPSLTNHYWYGICYVILLLLAPFLNKAIVALGRSHHLGLVVILGIVCAVLFHLNPFFQSAAFIGHPTHSVLWFITLYVTTAYIKLYPIKHPVLFGPVLFLASTVVLFAVTLVSCNVGGILDKLPILKTLLSRVDLSSYNALPALLLSVSSFVTFSQCSIRATGKVASIFAAISPSFFAIYLIQEHTLVRDALWAAVNVPAHAQGPYLIPLCLLVFLGLFAAAAVLYGIYFLLNKWFLGKLADRICLGITMMYQKIRPQQ